MPNKNYVKGRAKEYRITKMLKADGYTIAQRTAGSHSPIDIFAINRKIRKIKFIQSKPDNFSRWEAKKIHKELDFLNGQWNVRFELI